MVERGKFRDLTFHSESVLLSVFESAMKHIRCEQSALKVDLRSPRQIILSGSHTLGNVNMIVEVAAPGCQSPGADDSKCSEKVCGASYSRDDGLVKPGVRSCRERAGLLSESLQSLCEGFRV